MKSRNLIQDDKNNIILLEKYKNFSFLIPHSSLIILFIMFFLAVPVFGQLNREQESMFTPPWWLTLEQGKLKFRSGDYGGALMHFEDARRQRRAQFEQMERDLIHLLSQNAVRRIGDSLDYVERYSRENYYTQATRALEELYYRVPKDSLNNSASRALTELGKLKNYPEAEFWIGEIYRIEGEYPLALAQYRRALGMREQFEDPNFSVTLQLRIGNIQYLIPDYREMERTYISIIEEYDTLWINRTAAENTRAENERRRAAEEQEERLPYAQASASFTTNAMTRTLRNEGVGRLLEMYRYNNLIVEPAHRHLGMYFARTGLPRATEHLMYAFLIQNTIIIEEITRRQFDFTIINPNPGRTGVGQNRQPSAYELLRIGEEMRKYPQIMAYAEEVEYYQTAYYLADSLLRNGNNINTARTIWEFLAAQPEAGEWRSRSEQQLRTPRLEPLFSRN